jgi:hypothetical protein
VIKSVVFDSEPVALRNRSGEGSDAIFKICRNVDVSDSSAGFANEVVMVVAGEIFGQLKSSRVVSCNEPANNTSIL